MASQFYMNNLLQWSATGMMHPSYFEQPQVVPGVLPPPTSRSSQVRNRLTPGRIGALLQGNDSLDTTLQTSFSSQYLAMANALSKAQQQQAVLNASNSLHPLHVFESSLSSLLAGQANALNGGGLNTINTSSSSGFERNEAGSAAESSFADEQPLDLSSKRALQAATQSAASNVLKLRDGKRQRSTPMPAVPQESKLADKAVGNTGSETDKDRTKPSSTTAATSVLSALTVTGKRNYSQADLDAAVKDIRCGRLGTRRASVVYGIPRSTLRNKIYKLEAAEELNGEPSQYKRRRTGGQTAASKADHTSTNGKKAPASASGDAGGSSCTIADSLKVSDGVASSRPPSNVTPTASTAIWESGCDSPATSSVEWNQMLWSPFARQNQTAETNGSNGTTSAEEKKNSQSPANSTESHGDWKRSRPKRGQYRKYDKDALDEAVKSVRRGEMSVHRAGSFYGVPHSTLEYKVKERNLLRNKNRQKSLDDNSSEFGGSDNGQTVQSSRSSTPTHSSPPAAADAIGTVRPPIATVQS